MCHYWCQECECQGNYSPPGYCQGTHTVSNRELFPARAPTVTHTVSDIALSLIHISEPTRLDVI
eukprot:3540441-Prorocentrum_lima.AAC.1